MSIASASVAEAMQVLDGEVVGEDCFFVGAVQPMRLLVLGAVPEIAEARLGEDRMARAEGDELAGRQPAVPRERFEDVADVGIGDPDVLAGLSTREVRAALVLDCGLHTRKIVERFARVNVTHALEYSGVFRSGARRCTLDYFITSPIFVCCGQSPPVARCRGVSR